VQPNDQDVVQAHRPNEEPSLPSGPLTRGRANGNGGGYGPERLFEYDEEPEKGLADYIRILFKRKWSIVAVFILGVLIAWGIPNLTKLSFQRAD
jgi:hypothetical protein